MTTILAGRYRKLQTLRRVIREKGALSALDVTLKKFFPSGNPWLSWDRRVLFRCYPPPLEGRGGRAQRLPSALAQAGELHGDPRAIAAGLARGEQCWVIQQGGAVVAHVWIGGPWSRLTSDTGYPLRRETEDGGPAWWWRDVWVEPDLRGQGLAGELFRAWRASLPDARTAVIYTEVAPDNPPSLHAHRKLGFTEIGRLTMVCVLGLRLYLCRGPGQPRISFRFAPRNLHFSDRG